MELGMKGMIFTELIELIEHEYGIDMVDELVETTSPPSGGIYTSVGTYDHRELIGYVAALSEKTGVPVAALIRTFGRWLFPKLVEGHPQLFGQDDDLFGFLEKLDGYIHVEVLKLYPDAELPKIETQRVENGDELRLAYVSARRLDEFAHGLLEGAAAHFDREVSITREELTDGRPGSIFTISPSGGR